MPTEAAARLFADLASYDVITEMIANGEAEDLYLECKAPTAPQLTRDLQMQLAKAISGFSNSEGGVVIWGVSTTRHAHSGLDVLSQIEPIGQCRQFEQQVVRVFPKLTTPTVTRFKTKTLAV